MSRDDLAPLFHPGKKGDDGQGFRQVTLLTYDAATGANSARVGGRTFTNLPILNTQECVSLRAGHVVIILKFHDSWMIIGRVPRPGSADFAGAALTVDSVAPTATNFGLSTTETTKVSSAISVPAWATEARVSITAAASVVNGSGASDLPVIRAYVGTSGSVEIAQLALNGHTAAISTSDVRTVLSPSGTLAVSATMRTAVGTWTANASNIVVLTASAIFRNTR